MIEPVPPLVTMPAGSVPVTASACSMPSVMAMISPSNLVPDGQTSRCSALTWPNNANASLT